MILATKSAFNGKLQSSLDFWYCACIMQLLLNIYMSQSNVTCSGHRLCAETAAFPKQMFASICEFRNGMDIYRGGKRSAGEKTLV